MQLPNPEFLNFRNLRERNSQYYPVRTVMKPTLSTQRCSTRFPLHLKVAVRTDTREHNAETQNISSGGVLMNLETELKPETPIEFTIRMPAAVLGSPTDVEVNCVGRVVRSVEEEDGQHTVAAVIDDYQFKRP
jgi:hypothetical protein